MSIPRDRLVDEASIRTVRQAARLLDDVYAELIDPARWCQGCFARDAAGQMIEGPIVDAVEAPGVACRCVFGSLLHHARARGYRIELAVQPIHEQAVIGIRRAPATFILAAWMLTRAALYPVLEPGVRPEEQFAAPPEEGMPSREDVLVAAIVIANEDWDHDDVLTMVAVARGLLDDELERRARHAR